MKTNTHKLFGLLVLAASLSTSGAALAIPIVDVVEKNPKITIEYLGSHTFTHDITDNGFVVGIDTLDSAVLTILLRDEATAGGAENFSFNLGPNGSPVQTELGSNVSGNAAGDIFTITLLTPSLADLGSDGIISVTIKSLTSLGNSGTSFIFVKSTLTAQVTKPLVGGPPTAVPEPASLALLGIGLAGLGAMRRRKTV